MKPYPVTGVIGMGKKEYKPPAYTYATEINGAAYPWEGMTPEQLYAARLSLTLGLENARLKGTGAQAYVKDMPDMDRLFPRGGPPP